ncbi:hypothetical protein [Qipengyuania sp. JC766]|uniref:hypothetical protein n=1 Tax=Qipengyuania sp. JC766 TaxID=3232139 RepID=UPI00345870C0
MPRNVLALRKNPTVQISARRWGLVAAAAIVVLLVVAWIDGGEEPLHTIEQPIDLPGDAR